MIDEKVLIKFIEFRKQYTANLAAYCFEKYDNYYKENDSIVSFYIPVVSGGLFFGPASKFIEPLQKEIRDYLYNEMFDGYLIRDIVSELQNNNLPNSDYFKPLFGLFDFIKKRNENDNYEPIGSFCLFLEFEKVEEYPSFFRAHSLVLAKLKYVELVNDFIYEIGKLTDIRMWYSTTQESKWSDPHSKDLFEIYTCVGKKLGETWLSSNALRSNKFNEEVEKLKNSKPSLFDAPLCKVNVTINIQREYKEE